MCPFILVFANLTLSSEDDGRTGSNVISVRKALKGDDGIRIVIARMVYNRQQEGSDQEVQ